MIGFYLVLFGGALWKLSKISVVSFPLHLFQPTCKDKNLENLTSERKIDIIIEMSLYSWQLAMFAITRLWIKRDSNWHFEKLTTSHLACEEIFCQHDMVLGLFKSD